MTSDPDSLIDKIASMSSPSPSHTGMGTTTTPTTTTTTGPQNRKSSHSPHHQPQPQPLSSPTSPPFDPIDFLNDHYQTESTLVAALPSLRSTLRTRITSLDTSISSTIQKQADLADLTLSDVSRAKSAILELHARVTTVQTKAALSERAVQEITRDMKRLDYAKKHLSRTITALKRLHMLVHAVTQLRECVRYTKPFPEYRSASNLMDATRLLLGHFEGYMNSVAKMRALKEDVEMMRGELEDGIIFGFRVVGFGLEGALERDNSRRGRGKGTKSVAARARDTGIDSSKVNKPNHKPPIKRSAAYDTLKDEPNNNDADANANNNNNNSNNSNSNNQTNETQSKPTGGDNDDDNPLSNPPMPPEVLSSACHALDSIGPNTRSDFIKLFCDDHLKPYNQLFDPKNNPSSTAANNTGGGGGSLLTSAAKASFKIRMPDVLNDNNNSSNNNNNSNSNELDNPSSTPNQNNPNPASLDQVERRYAWYRRMLKEQLEDKFPNVFPPSWNMQYHMTLAFLTTTGEHFLLLLSNSVNGAGGGGGDLSRQESGGNNNNNKKDKNPKQNNSNNSSSNNNNNNSGNSNPFKDRDCTNVTVLLKALQKTMLFEKEMTAWLQREYRAVFLAFSDSDGPNNDNSKTGTNGGPAAFPHLRPDDDDDVPLEFDDAGRSAAANTSEGIRIKYERKMKDRRRREMGQKADTLGVLEDLDTKAQREREGAPVPVPPLIGVASTAFDRFMGPYIALEEQNMDEMLVDSTSDRAVDTRGELPVFTSSTALFVYIKNSITRCTVLTRGKTLFLLYRAFQDTLRKYAQVLAGKFPPTVLATTISGINISLPVGGGGGGGDDKGIGVYRIAKGEETTICHVIDTCEYCADTVEALQDLIGDKIEDRYKPKIDMSEEQEVFYDVTAKGIRVLVSGLGQKTEAAFKAMSNINWGNLESVGEESSYVRSMHNAIQPFVVNVKELLPNSYFRNFCDKFAVAFTTAFYNGIIRCKRISESGTQQFLLDVYNLKTLLLKMPVLDRPRKSPKHNSSPTATPTKAGSTIAPAMYTKMVTKEFHRIETLLKLVGTPSELLIDVFRVQCSNGSALDLQTIMNLKGMKRNEQAAMLEKFGFDRVMAMKGAAAGATTGGSMIDNIQAMREGSSHVADKVNSDLLTMRNKVEEFRKGFR